MGGDSVLGLGFQSCIYQNADPERAGGIQMPPAFDSPDSQLSSLYGRHSDFVQLVVGCGPSSSCCVSLISSLISRFR